ncbi:hypothetical protein GCM10027194_32860 [Thalassiella azotivora]
MPFSCEAYTSYVRSVPGRIPGYATVDADCPARPDAGSTCVDTSAGTPAAPNRFNLTDSPDGVDTDTRSTTGSTTATALSAVAGGTGSDVFDPEVLDPDDVADSPARAPPPRPSASRSVAPAAARSAGTASERAANAGAIGWSRTSSTPSPSPSAPTVRFNDRHPPRPSGTDNGSVDTRTVDVPFGFVYSSKYSPRSASWERPRENAVSAGGAFATNACSPNPPAASPPPP